MLCIPRRNYQYPRGWNTSWEWKSKSYLDQKIYTNVILLFLLSVSRVFSWEQFTPQSTYVLLMEEIDAVDIHPINTVEPPRYWNRHQGRLRREMGRSWTLGKNRWAIGSIKWEFCWFYISHCFHCWCLMEVSFLI